MLLKLDFTDETPIYIQIRNQIVLGIADGRLAPGEKLPTIRALANESGINMMTANKAYQLLKQEGFITADRRSGVSVRADMGQTQRACMPEKIKNNLRLLISEIKLANISENALLETCRQIYREMEGNI